MTTTEPTAGFCPYKGLQPYEEKDRAYFFGRERDTSIIISNLYAAPLTVLYGASGVGKSSVLQAGVVPRLRDESRVAVVVFREWQSKDFLQTLRGEALRAVRAKNPEAQVEDDPALPLDKFLRRCTRAARCTLFFILDQFEEYFLYHPAAPDSDDDGFDAQFARAVNRPEIGTNFLLAMRDDGLSKLDRFQVRIPHMMGNLLRLEHLDAASARNAIRRPLERYNERHGRRPPASIDHGEGGGPDLVARLLEDLKTGKVTLDVTGQGQISAAPGDREARIETPFLQMVLTRLWDERDRATNRLELATYERLGGAEPIVRSHLDKVMSSQFADPADRDLAARLFHYLVTPSGLKIALAPGDLASMIGEPLGRVALVLNRLSASEARILGTVDIVRGQQTVKGFEITHDVLAPAILDWRARYVREKAEDAAKTEALQKKAEAEKRLAEERAEAERRAAAKQRELELAEARAAEQRELAEAQEREVAARGRLLELERQQAVERIKTVKRLRWLVAAMSVMALLAAGTAVYAWTQQRKAMASEAKAVENARLAGVYAAESAKLRKEGEDLKRQADEQRDQNVELKRLADRAQADAELATSRAEEVKQAADDARANADDALARLQAEQRQTEDQRALRQLALNAETINRSGDSERAAAEYQSALSKYDEIEAKRPPRTESEQAEHLRGKANTNYMLGETYLKLAQFGEDEDAFDDEEEPTDEEKQLKARAADFIKRALDAFAAASDYYGQYGNLAQDHYEEAAVLKTIAKVHERESRRAENPEATKEEADKAIGHLERALALYEAGAGSKYVSDTDKEQVNTLQNLIELALSNQPEKVDAFYPKLAELHRKAGAKADEAETYAGLGRFHSADPRKAAEHLAKAVALYRQSPGKEGRLAQTLSQLGGIYMKLPESKALALPTLLEANAVFDKLPSYVVPDVKSAIAKLYEEQGDKRNALTFYEQSLPMYARLKRIYDVSNSLGRAYRRGEAQALEAVARLGLELNEKQKALNAYLNLPAVYQELRDYDGEVGALRRTGELYEAMGQPEKAQEFYNKAKAVKPPTPAPTPTPEPTPTPGA